MLALAINQQILLHPSAFRCDAMHTVYVRTFQISFQITYRANRMKTEQKLNSKREIEVKWVKILIKSQRMIDATFFLLFSGNGTFSLLQLVFIISFSSWFNLIHSFELIINGLAIDRNLISLKAEGSPPSQHRTLCSYAVGFSWTIATLMNCIPNEKRVYSRPFHWVYVIDTV